MAYTSEGNLCSGCRCRARSKEIPTTKRVNTIQFFREALPNSFVGRLTPVDAPHGKFGSPAQLDKTGRGAAVGFGWIVQAG